MNLPVGYIATWGEGVPSNGFDTISKIVFYYRSIGMDHGEFGLVSSMFAYQDQGNVPLTVPAMCSYMVCSNTMIQKWIKSLTAKGFVIITKDVVNGQNIHTLNFKPILERIVEAQDRVVLPTLIKTKSKFIQQEFALA